MTWTQQRQLVNSLSGQAQDRRREARLFRGKLKGWMTNYLGSVETLAWLFATGTFWAAGRSSAGASGGTRRSIVSVVNTSLLAWQLVNRQFDLDGPIAGDSSAEQRRT